MSVTELTSQLDRSELKEAASRNTASEGVRRRRRACKQGQGGDRTAVHVGDAAHIPPREVPIEVRALVEHCQQPRRSQKQPNESVSSKRMGDARPHLYSSLSVQPAPQVFRLVTAPTSQSSIGP